MNGVQIASSEKLAGTWRLFQFDVTSAAKAGELNSLAVEVFPPQPRDLAITLVDWAPMPADKEMGIWRDVHITATGPVTLRYPAVLTKLNLPSTDRATLSIRAELVNAADHPVEAVVKGQIENLAFEQPVHLGAKETQVVRFTPEKFAQLSVSNPRLWWPAQVGKQELYPLDLSVELNGQVSDSAHILFGIRQVTSNIDEKGHRLFQINGKNILIRGAGYSFDLLLRSSPERQEAELSYVRDLNLNTVRLEGKLENDHSWTLPTRWVFSSCPAGAVVTNGRTGWPGVRKPKPSPPLLCAIRSDDWKRHLSANQPDLWQRLRASGTESSGSIWDILQELDWPNPVDLICSRAEPPRLAPKVE